MYETLENLRENIKIQESNKDKHVVVIDNYDSFVYNLVQYLEELGAQTTVIRNDACSDSEVVDKILTKLKATHVLISPGPGKPKDAGISNAIIKKLAGKIPILGVCLGHQAIAENFGALVNKAPYLMHGKTSVIKQLGRSPLFTEIPKSFTATRYHSLIVDRNSMHSAEELQLEAETEDSLVMAISHKRFPTLLGIQYHPESILSEYGHRLLLNFLRME